MTQSLKTIFMNQAARSTLWGAFLEYHLSPSAARPAFGVVPPAAAAKAQEAPSAAVRAG